MKLLATIFCTSLLLAQTAQVQIIHNSPYPTVDIYVDGSVALTGVEYRACTGLVDLPINTTVGIAPTGGDVIAEFPFELATDGSYVVTASGIVGNEDTPFNLLASTLDQAAQDDDSFALKVLHGVTDAPAVDIYANGALLVENLAYGDYAGYLQVPVADYTIDVTANGSSAAVASFSAPLAGLGGGAGVVYASGFLAPTETDSAFTLILATPSGYTVELPATGSALDIFNSTEIISQKFLLKQNYPNPFNPSTEIVFDLNESSHISLTIFDLVGREVLQLYDGYTQAGVHTHKWNSKNILGKRVPSGLYLYTLKSDNNSSTKKMFLMK